jgi:hypothetical protein
VESPRNLGSSYDQLQKVTLVLDLNDPIVSRYINRLPLRWAFGGSLLGGVWSAISSYLQGSFKDPAGGLGAGLIRLLVIIVLPLALLGVIWGYSERSKLVRSAHQGSAVLLETISRTVRRQVGKAMLCGMTFGMFVNQLLRARASLPWDTLDHVATNLSASLGFVLLAIPIGWVVGYTLKRNLSRNLSR